jgi:hypothetical protein
MEFLDSFSPGSTKRTHLFAAQQRKLKRLLVEQDIDAGLIQRVLDSGYFAWGIGQLGSGESKPGVMDSYYGNKWAGLIELEQFLKFLRTGSLDLMPPTFPEYNVTSPAEVREILSRPEHTRFAGRMSFRGQTTDYWIKRPLPNPRAQRADGSERMIVPSWWRRWINKDLGERESTTSGSVFSSPLLAAPMLFHDIPDWRDHFAPHHASGEDGPPACAVCEEMAARQREHMMNSSFSNEVPLLEQHYGIPTIGLDITFDPEIALFFASHRAVKKDGGRWSFEPVERGGHHGVVYCFVFEWPSVTETQYLIRDVGLFRNLQPLRPIRQHCGLPAFHVHEIAAAVRDLHAVFYLDKAFDTVGLPSASYLFPNRKEDPFYGALLGLRDLAPEIWGQIAEYDGL